MKKGGVLFLLGIALFLSAFIIVSADTGPHQSATLYFAITYNNSSIAENFSARLLACRETECEVDNGALCTNGVCEFMYYRIERVPRQMKLIVKVNGENFTSDIINFSWINPILYYDVSLNESNKVTVSPSPEQKISETPAYLFSLSFILALLLTIIIETLVLVIFLRKWKIKAGKWKKPILTLLIANIISVPLVWIIFFSLLAALAALVGLSQLASMLVAILAAEAFAVVFEAYFIYWLNKKIITLRKSFILSIVMNLASFIVGGIALTALLGFMFA